LKSEDHRQFVERFLRDEAALRVYLLTATGDIDATEDLLQRTAVALLEKWDQFDESRGFRPWALGFARLEVLKWRQRAARSRERLSVEALDVLAEEADRHADELGRRGRFLQECIEALGEERRKVLGMKYGHGLKVSAIAERIGKSVAAVEMMLVRIRRALRDCVERKAAPTLRRT
jgi:RNA polymerase sigma-70 factor (ECF subfamily)